MSCRSVFQVLEIVQLVFVVNPARPVDCCLEQFPPVGVCLVPADWPVAAVDNIESVFNGAKEYLVFVFVPYL